MFPGDQPPMSANGLSLGGQQPPMLPRQQPVHEAQQKWDEFNRILKMDMQLRQQVHQAQQALAQQIWNAQLADQVEQARQANQARLAEQARQAAAQSPVAPAQWSTYWWYHDIPLDEFNAILVSTRVRNNLQVMRDMTPDEIQRMLIGRRPTYAAWYRHADPTDFHRKTVAVIEQEARGTLAACSQRLHRREFGARVTDEEMNGLLRSIPAVVDMRQFPSSYAQFEVERIPAETRFLRGNCVEMEFKSFTLDLRNCLMSLRRLYLAMADANGDPTASHYLAQRGFDPFDYLNELLFICSLYKHHTVHIVASVADVAQMETMRPTCPPNVCVYEFSISLTQTRPLQEADDMATMIFANILGSTVVSDDQYEKAENRNDYGKLLSWHNSLSFRHVA